MPAETLESLRNFSPDICRDFVYFRQLVARSRSYYDDNINHRLNDINTADHKECRRMRDTLKHIHADRQTKLESCLKIFEEDGQKDGSILHKKEIALLEAELSVEDIICGRTMSIFYSKCRSTKGQ